MKRSPMPARRSRLSRVSEKKAAQGKSFSTLKAVNPERQKKAAQRSREKHRAYMRSETRRVVEVRSRGLCEFIITPDPRSTTRFAPMLCGERATDHHHKTYARYGGKELPTDMLHVCRAHHDYLESLKPAGNRYSRARRAATGEAK